MKVLATLGVILMLVSMAVLVDRLEAKITPEQLTHQQVVDLGAAAVKSNPTSPLSAVDIAAISWVESNHKPKAIGDNGHAVGAWQFHVAAWRHALGADAGPRTSSLLGAIACAKYAIISLKCPRPPKVEHTDREWAISHHNLGNCLTYNAEYVTKVETARRMILLELKRRK